MAGRIALVATGRSPLPTGTTLLEADLAEDVDVRALDRALTLHDVEIQVLPAPARPRPQPEEAPETTVAPAPLAFPAEEPDTGAEPDEPAWRPEHPVHPVKDADADPLAGKSDDEVRSELEAAAAFDEEVKALVQANSRPQLLKLAKHEEATHGKSSTKQEIAVEIVEKRQVLRSFSGEGRAG